MCLPMWINSRYILINQVKLQHSWKDHLSCSCLADEGTVQRIKRYQCLYVHILCVCLCVCVSVCGEGGGVTSGYLDL